MASPATPIVAQPEPQMGLSERRFRCANCLGVAREAEYRYGCCRTHGRHEEHRYCPSCGVSIDWYGYALVGAER